MLAWKVLLSFTTISSINLVPSVPSAANKQRHLITRSFTRTRFRTVLTLGRSFSSQSPGFQIYHSCSCNHEAGGRGGTSAPCPSLSFRPTSTGFLYAGSSSGTRSLFCQRASCRDSTPLFTIRMPSSRPARGSYWRAVVAFLQQMC